jgi:hypothetical protein
MRGEARPTLPLLRSCSLCHTLATQSGAFCACSMQGTNQPNASVFVRSGTTCVLVKLSRCMRWRGGKAPIILNLGTRWKTWSGVSIQPLYPQEEVWVSPKPFWPFWRNKNFLPLLRTKLGFLYPIENCTGS